MSKLSLYHIEDGKLIVTPHPGQYEALTAPERFIFITAGTQSGKCLAIDTPILTNNGYRTIGEIEVGDVVFDELGCQCDVVYTSPVYYNHECYQITFDDGCSIVADSDHRWWVQSRYQRVKVDKRVKRGTQREPRPLDYSILTTREITDDLIYHGTNNDMSNYSISLAKPADLDEQELPLSPYFLGFWLGDGSAKEPSIATIDKEIVDHISSDGYAVNRYGRSRGRAYAYYVSEYKGKSVISLLRSLDVLGNKHIPHQYMIGSIEQRLRLLQGLMDADGCCFKSGGFSFVNTNKGLVHGVRELMWSLGIKSSFYVKPVDGQKTQYILGGHTPLKIFRLKRKRDRLRSKYNPSIHRRFIRSIRLIDSVPVRCISVSSSSKLFLCGRGLIPTHNTSFAPLWLYNEVLNTSQPGDENDYLAVTSSFDLFKLKFLPEMIKFFCETLKIGRYWAADRLIEIKCLSPDHPKAGEFLADRAVDPMWARIILRSAQSEGGLESATVKAAVLDECGMPEFSIGAWEAVQRRLSLAQGRILGATTLYYFGGWLYDVYRRWLNGASDVRFIQFPSYMNPSFDKEEYNRTKAIMPEWKHALLYDGEYHHPSGLIYKDFDEVVMVVDDFPVPKEWERVVGIDFGGANLATVWFALNPSDGRWYIYHTTLMGHLPTAEHVAIAQAEATGIPKLTAVGGAKAEGQQRDDWWNEGFYVEEPPVSSVEVGIARMIALIKTDRLRIFRSCEGLLSEMRQYRRKLDDQNNPTEVIVDKNKFHFCDGARYAASWIEDVPPGVEILSYEELAAKFEKEGRYEYA